MAKAVMKTTEKKPVLVTENAAKLGGNRSLKEFESVILDRAAENTATFGGNLRKIDSEVKLLKSLS